MLEINPTRFLKKKRFHVRCLSVTKIPCPFYAEFRPYVPLALHVESSCKNTTTPPSTNQLFTSSNCRFQDPKQNLICSKTYFSLLLFCTSAPATVPTTASPQLFLMKQTEASEAQSHWCNETVSHEAPYTPSYHRTIQWSTEPTNSLKNITQKSTFEFLSQFLVQHIFEPWRDRIWSTEPSNMHAYTEQNLEVFQASYKKMNLIAFSSHMGEGRIRRNKKRRGNIKHLDHVWRCSAFLDWRSHGCCGCGFSFPSSKHCCRQ